MSVNYVDENGKLQRIAGGTLYADSPIGAIVSFGGSTAPSGWLLCQGQAVSRTTYSELFGAIGTAFGSGDGSTTFNVPDLREATTKGVGLTGKSSNHYDSDGVALGEFVEDRIKSHSHIVPVNQSSGGVTGLNVIATNNFSFNTSNTGGATNEVKAVGVNYIIKAVQVGVPQDIQSAIDSMLTPKELNVSQVSNSYITINESARAFCIGKLVTVNLPIIVNTGISDWTQFASIPVEVDTVRYVGQYNQNYPELQIKPNSGKTYISTAITTTGNYYISFSFKIA